MNLKHRDVKWKQPAYTQHRFIEAECEKKKKEASKQVEHFLFDRGKEVLNEQGRKFQTASSAMFTKGSNKSNSLNHLLRKNSFLCF